MKKLIAIGIAVVMVLGLSSLIYADTIQTTKAVTVSLTVDSQFGFTIWDTEFTQNLGNVLPGAGATGNLHMAATSNHVLPWTISANSAGLVGQTQVAPDTLPVEMTTFDGGAGLTGTLVSNLVLTGLDQAIYVSGLGEAPVSGLAVDGIFAVNSLVTTKQDSYAGTINLTMTE